MLTWRLPEVAGSSKTNFGLWTIPSGSHVRTGCCFATFGLPNPDPLCTDSIGAGCGGMLRAKQDIGVGLGIGVTLSNHLSFSPLFVGFLHCSVDLSLFSSHSSHFHSHEINSPHLNNYLFLRCCSTWFQFLITFASHKHASGPLICCNMFFVVHFNQIRSFRPNLCSPPVSSSQTSGMQVLAHHNGQRHAFPSPHVHMCTCDDPPTCGTTCNKMAWCT